MRVIAGSDQSVRGNYFYLGPTAGASTGDHPECIMRFDSAMPSYQDWMISNNHIGPTTYTPGNGNDYISSYFYQTTASLVDQGDNSSSLDIIYNPRLMGGTINIGPLEQ